jgi:hypothetical protein
MIRQGAGEEPQMSYSIKALFSALLVLSPAIALAQHDHSMGQDTLTKPSATKATKTAFAPAEGASIKIISPSKDQVFKGDKVPLEFKLTKGKRGNHAHAYVDGELMGMFESAKGTLNGVKPGKHVLELRVVASDHQTELDARDTVEFTIK